ncbi:hypothetical protein GCM10010376_84370 [Streptomyces violaceusniger]
MRRTARLEYLAMPSGNARPLLAALFPEDEAEDLDPRPRGAASLPAARLRPLSPTPERPVGRRRPSGRGAVVPGGGIHCRHR